MTSSPITSTNNTIAQDIDGLGTDGSSVKRSNALSNRLTNVLSSSYADTEIRDALRLFDARYGDKDIEHDIDLRYETQKEVIEANARIIDDFSKVAQVRAHTSGFISHPSLTCCSNSHALER